MSLRALRLLEVQKACMCEGRTCEEIHSMGELATLAFLARTMLFLSGSGQEGAIIFRSLCFSCRPLLAVALISIAGCHLSIFTCKLLQALQ